MSRSMPRMSAWACAVQTMRLAIAVRRFFRQRLLGHLLPVVHRQAELSQNVCVRNWLVVLEPFIGFSDGLALGMAQGVAILIGRDHRLEEMNHGGELAGAELVEQVMGVLSVSGHCAPPSPSPSREPFLRGAQASTRESIRRLPISLRQGGKASILIVAHRPQRPEPARLAAKTTVPAHVLR